MKNTGKYGDFKETLVKILFERFVQQGYKRKKKPKPPCLALKSHLRILPNGDVPVCLYNSTIVGNLNEKSLKEVWFGINDDMEASRRWVKNCKGCWAGCETIVSAIYSGDIVKGLF